MVFRLYVLGQVSLRNTQVNPVYYGFDGQSLYMVRNVSASVLNPWETVSCGKLWKTLKENKEYTRFTCLLLHQW